MSMGDAKVETLSNNKRSRIPQKPLNKFIKAQLLATLKRDDITIETKPDWGRHDTLVKDTKGKTLFGYHCAGDYGYYNIWVPAPKAGAENIVVAEMDWFENDNYTNPQQQDIFDVFDATDAKSRELEAIKKDRESLTPEEIQALKTLGLSK